MPTIQEEPIVSEHQPLLDDLTAAESRFKGNKTVDTKEEMKNTFLPLLRATIEHFGERADRQEAALDELIEQSGSYIQGDLARQIMGTLALGEALANLILETKDKVGLKKAQEAAVAFKTAANMTAQVVEEATGEPEEEELPDDEEEEDEEEGTEEAQAGDDEEAEDEAAADSVEE